MSKSLPDLVADIERMLGVRTEVITRWYSEPEHSIGTSHLDRFAEIVRSFSEISGASASTLVEYLLAAKEKEDGLETGEVTQKKTSSKSSPCTSPRDLSGIWPCHMLVVQRTPMRKSPLHVAINGLRMPRVCLPTCAVTRRNTRGSIRCLSSTSQVSRSGPALENRR